MILDVQHNCQKTHLPLPPHYSQGSLVTTADMALALYIIVALGVAKLFSMCPTTLPPEYLFPAIASWARALRVELIEEPIRTKEVQLHSCTKLLGD
jgi:hypothetical protein